VHILHFRGRSVSLTHVGALEFLAFDAKHRKLAMAAGLTKQELRVVDLPPGVRTRRLGSLRFFFNYNPYSVHLMPLAGLETLVGGMDLPPAGVLIGREKEP
jgi:Beta-galactosidase C-terminal domain